MLETKKHEYHELEQEMSREIKALSGSLSEVDERKTRTQKDSKLMSGTTADEENKTLDAAS